MEIVKFKDETDLSIKLMEHSSAGLFLRHSDYATKAEYVEKIGHVSSVRIYVGDNDAMYNLMVNEDHHRSFTPFANMDKYKLNKVLTALGLAVPQKVANEIKVESERNLLEFFRGMMKYSDVERVDNASLRERLSALRDMDIAKSVKELQPFPGVTVNVATFLQEAENRLGAKGKVHSAQ